MPHAKLDQMVAEQSHGEYHVDLPAPDRPHGRSPEKSAIIRLDAKTWKISRARNSAGELQVWSQSLAAPGILIRLR